MVRRIGGFLALEDEARITNLLDLGYVGLLLHFPQHRDCKELDKGRISVPQKILALHLAFGRFPHFPFCFFCVGLGSTKHKELVYLLGIDVKKGSRSQIDTPAFRRMLHIGVGLVWIVRKMFRTPSEAFLKHIKNRHYSNDCPGYNLNF